MKRILRFLKQRLTEACIFFTVTLFIMAAVLQIAADKLSGGIVFPLLSLLLVFGFSLILSFLNLIFRIRRLNIPAKLLLHALLTLAVFVLIFAVMTQQLSDPQALLYVLFFAAILYAVIVVIALIIRAIYLRDVSEKKEYDPQFIDKNK